MDGRDGGKDDGDSLYTRTIFRANSGDSGLWPVSQFSLRQTSRIRPSRLTEAARLSLVFWSKLCDDWKSALVVVKPETLIGWHRRAFNLFWKLKSRPGRPKRPRNIRQLIVRMVKENATRGQGSVADELALKLGPCRPLLCQPLPLLTARIGRECSTAPRTNEMTQTAVRRVHTRSVG